nr:MAG TPA: hypothetical protein [Caudoviricetes sp.]DAT16632.1 MAG TPA: hypothetical protein [Caudoviricetes sp.]DAW73532.1 MAG TPA: hypothetical protein [Caudoviricetes sp.]DAX26124.1 MAG TPA: hypothetical protein [Caudoviricetes sp.]
MSKNRIRPMQMSYVIVCDGIQMQSFDFEALHLRDTKNGRFLIDTISLIDSPKILFKRLSLLRITSQ